MKITINTDNDTYTGKWGFLARVIVMTLATILAAKLLPGVHINSLLTAILTAVVISLLNNFIRPILIVVTLPFTIVSMGLFLLVINALIVILASGLITDFNVDGFGSALLFSLLLTLFNYLLELPNKAIRRKQYKNHSEQDIHKKHNDDEDDYTPYEEVD